jgi:hypothetical protein
MAKKERLPGDLVNHISRHRCHQKMRGQVFGAEKLVSI